MVNKLFMVTVPPTIDFVPEPAAVKEENEQLIPPFKIFWFVPSKVIKEVGLVKVDVQGMEEHVLKGAENTLKEYKPVVILEEKVVKTRPNDRSAIERARNILLSYNYRFAELVHNDAIYISN